MKSVPLPDNEATLYLQLQTRKSPPRPFIYAVLTTNIFCLPTCPSRLARRANVKFFANPSQAAAAGFRPCKRCKPDVCFCEPSSPVPQLPVFSPSSSISSAQSGPVSPTALPTSTNESSSCAPGSGPDTPATPDISVASLQKSSNAPVLPSARRQIAAVQQACALIRKARSEGRLPSLQEVASSVGMTRWHFGRVFRRIVGVGPGEWARRLELGKNEGSRKSVPEEEQNASNVEGKIDGQSAAENLSQDWSSFLEEDVLNWNGTDFDGSGESSPLSFDGLDLSLPVDSKALTMTSEELAVWDAFFESDAQMLGLAVGPAAAFRCGVNDMGSDATWLS